MADIKIFTDMIEDEAKLQIENISRHKAFENCKIRIMPDVHAGKGCVCGFTADLGDKVVPNLVGVDIGCGMLTVCLGKIDVDFEKLDSVIRSRVPYGMKVGSRQSQYAEINGCSPKDCVAKFKEKDYRYFACSIGSLGSGNHFIEIDADKEGNKYLVIHTGSRNFGKKVCEYWQDVAVEKMKPNKELTDEDVLRVFDELTGKQ